MHRILITWNPDKGEVIESKQKVSISSEAKEWEILSAILALLEHYLKDKPRIQRIILGTGLHKISREYLILNKLKDLETLMQTINSYPPNEEQLQKEALKSAVDENS